MELFRNSLHTWRRVGSEGGVSKTVGRHDSRKRATALAKLIWTGFATFLSS